MNKEKLTLDEATKVLQDCVDYLQSEGYALDIKVGLKPLKPKPSTLIGT